MKLLKKIVAVAFIAVAILHCKQNAQPEIKTVGLNVQNDITTLNPEATYAKAEFTIEGMTCKMGCAKTIEKKMAKMEGVKSAVVDYDRKLAMVEYDEAMVNTNSLEKTVMGVAETYKVKNMKNVEDFSKAVCSKDCKKECCKSKIDAKKIACAKDCKKSCCASEAKA